ncbi:MAG: CDP-alcohol phosphatidyltransferase family protein [Rhodanobacter sp.]|nr:MAG: CDP-alcohol phosphatidyltransferase family protein [Rhodanobacter sp.]TAM10036.1 MAG: CDP-alcohol phosphatidyltransferase family protein [Rhodanobacter sp.]TAM34732.1 MAG: CDP-alcohol phosphatidyltransferase family protein [Rhodanobacter sp.]
MRGSRDSGATVTVVVGLIVGGALLAVLAATVGLSPSGWLIGIASTLAVFLLYASVLARSGRRWPTPADRVTALRAVLVAGISALVASHWPVGGDPRALVGLAIAALLLDNVDGRVARRTHLATPLGARFDMEVDAWLILALSVHAMPRVGAWALAIGAARYALLLAARAWPWLRAEMPPRYWNKVVASIQGIALVIVAAGVLPRAGNQIVLIVAGALLAESFGHQVAWLRAHRASQLAADVGPRAPTGTAGFFVAAGVLWLALILPDWPHAPVPAALLRAPVALIALAALALMLPRRLHGWLAMLFGLALAAMAWLKLLDLGFQQAFERPFDPLADGAYVVPAFGVLVDTFGRLAAIIVTAAVGLAVIAIPVVLVHATRRVVTAVRRWPRPTAARAVGALGALWLVLAVADVRVPNAPGPVASADTLTLAAHHVRGVASGLADHRRFARSIRADRHATVPTSCLLAGLRGKDVLLVFVESYGRVAVSGTAFSHDVDARLHADTATLANRGYAVRSGFLVSPTFGGGSWLAHSTLQSGLWVDSQRRYDQLMASQRLTLARAFRQAGWRTVVDAPADTGRWPQGLLFYRYQMLYNGRNVGYRGPAFSYAPMPDQYTLLKLRDNELAKTARKPVFAEVDFVSSHHPWTPLPRLVPWSAVGDGNVFAPMPAQGLTPDAAFRNPATVQRLYGASIRYSMDALVSWLARWPDPNLVVIALGDHQPWGIVSGTDPGHEVPVSVIAQDPAIMSAIARWHWPPGLLPATDAPVWPMSAFRDRFFGAFGTACPAPAQPAQRSDKA